MAKWLLLLLALAVVVALSTTGVLASARDAPGRVERLVGDSGGPPARQAREQVSQYEFNSIAAGTTEARLRALVGDPAARQSTEIEGIALECWYYGVARATGAYQFCFQDGVLRTKTRYNTWRRGAR